MFRVHFSILIAAASVGLSACVQQPARPFQNPATSQNSSLTIPSPLPPSTSSSMEAPLEAGDVPASAAAESSVASSSGLDYASEERLTDTGVLEIGRSNAPLTLTVFTNISCAYCAQFTQEQLPKLLAGFVRRGDLLLRLHLLPLQKYPSSRSESVALICAANEHKGLDMYRALAVLATRTDAALLKAAADIGIDKATFDACRAAPQVATFIDAQAQAATASGVTLVPTFFVGNARVTGLMEYPDLRGKIEQALKR